MSALTRGEAEAGGRTAWRLSRKQSWLTLFVLLGVLTPLVGVSALLLAAQVREALQDGADWLDAILIFPVAIVGWFAALGVAGVPLTIMNLFDRRPILAVDADGLRLRDLNTWAGYWTTRAARWSEIDEVRLPLFATRNGQSLPAGSVEVGIARDDGRHETWRIWAHWLGEDPAALHQMLKALWAERAGRSAEQSQPRSGSRSWRASRAYAGMVLAFAVIAGVMIVFQLGMWSSAMLSGVQGLEIILVLVMILFIAGMGWALLPHAVDAVAAFLDDRPRLAIDHEGLHVRRLSISEFDYPQHTIRWSNVESIDLTPQKGRRGSHLLVKPLGETPLKIDASAIGESPESLFAVLDAEWRARTGRAS